MRASVDGALARGRRALNEAAASANSYLAGLVGVRGLRLLVNTGVAVLVLSLPFAATASSSASSADGEGMGYVIAAIPADALRAQPVARAFISSGRNPQTMVAEGARPIQEYIVNQDENLGSIANFYDVSVEALAFANGITDAHSLQIGQHLRVPPAEGALYTVAEGDTVESVAKRFKVEATVIMSYNRLYFEPEHFAPGQLIFVRGAELPALKEPERPAPTRFTPPTFALPAPRGGRLSWPVAGFITQNFWWGHTGTDVAAPYGTGIGASDDGIVSATGWVPVGGLRVCVKHAWGMETCYYHTSVVKVEVGQQVSRGQIIAAIGLTGVTTGPHVHWECRYFSQLVDCRGY